MFEIGFFELLVIALVTLVVVGPERLPWLARTAGRWVGRVQRYFRAVKAEFSQELALQEYYRLHDKVLAEARAAGQSVEEEARRLERAMLEKLREEQPQIIGPVSRVRTEGKEW